MADAPTNALDLGRLVQENPEAARLIDDIVEERVDARIRQAIDPVVHSHLRETLTNYYTALNQRHQFAPGGFVRWKLGLKNKRRPEYGTPVVVMEVLPEAVLDLRAESDSRYFREPLDLVIGMLDTDGEFLVYHVDSRRFEQYEDPEH